MPNCKKCTTPMNVRTNKNTGQIFYSCPAMVDGVYCNYTESAEQPKHIHIESDVPGGTEPTLEEINARLKRIEEKSIADGVVMADKLNVVSIEMEALAMAAAIPGFGKLADELTDDERVLRAEYFAKRCATLQIGMPLPYDKTRNQA